MQPARPHCRTLAECLKQPQDNFLLLRFIAAALVIFGHSYATAGSAGAAGDFIARQNWGPGVYTGSIAVDLFFVISGFLVTGSYLRRDDIGDFIKSRVLRILPAYFVCVGFTAFVLGAFYTNLPLIPYWTDPATRNYVLINMTFDQLAWTLPGVFTDNPLKDIVNGCLWTLPAEVRMYLYVAALGVLRILKHHQLGNAALIGLFILGITAPASVPLISYQAEFFGLSALFALGAFCYINRDTIPINGYVLLALAFLCWCLHGTSGFMPMFGLTLGYFCFWFAYCTNFHFFNRFGDYSYGLYLWGFPIEQAVAHHLSEPKPMAIFLISFPITLLIAMLSWHCLEKPALKLKNRPVFITFKRLILGKHRRSKTPPS